MKYFNGVKKHSYFEGWFFRHQYGDNSIAFIPSVSVDEKGEKLCLIQVITNKKTYKFEFDFAKFSAESKELKIVIGENVFTKNGCRINLKNDEVSITANLDYGKLTELSGDIMGIFSVVPLMQCKHGIISMKHSVNGEININGKKEIVKDGVGFIEKDCGSSFPEHYIWLQANDFKEDVSLFVSIATIPLMIGKFKGHIATLNYNGEEIKFATYNGSKMEKSYIYDKSPTNEVALKKGNWLLNLIFVENSSLNLRAPSNGKMNRTTKESLNATLFLKLYKNDELVLDTFSNNSGLEYLV